MTYYTDDAQRTRARAARRGKVSEVDSEARGEMERPERLKQPSGPACRRFENPACRASLLT